MLIESSGSKAKPKRFDFSERVVWSRQGRTGYR